MNSLSVRNEGVLEVIGKKKNISGSWYVNPSDIHILFRIYDDYATLDFDGASKVYERSTWKSEINGMLIEKFNDQHKILEASGIDDDGHPFSIQLSFNKDGSINCEKTSNVYYVAQLVNN